MEPNLPDILTLTRAQNDGGDFSKWRTADLCEYVGGFSNPSKMPGYAYGLPAELCITGSKLREKAGTTCHGCYAYKGAYAWSTTKAAYQRRFDRLGIPFWSEAIAEVLNRRAKSQPHFRWHDSGDIQSVEHLRNICRVAEMTPTVKHWIPTREYRIVAEYRKLYDIPANVTIRMSAHKLGGFAPKFDAPLTTSTVADHDLDGAFNCPSRFQNNACGDCRECWNPEVAIVNYHLH